MKKVFLIIILLFVNLHANGNKKITLQLSWLHQFQFAGYYMAKEKGFYDKVGLDVHMKQVIYNKDLVSIIEDKEADFAIGRSSLLIDKINGRDVVALGAMYQHSPMMLLVTEDSGIKTIKDLQDKKIMMTHNARSTASILAMLNANKLNNNELKIIPHTFNLEDLISGKTDAMASYLSNEPIRLKEKNIKYRILHPRDFGFDFYNDILFTSSAYIKENPKITKKFYEATLKGWKYAFENITETAELIHSKYNTQNKSLLHFIKEGEILRTLAFNDDGDIGCLEKNRLDDIVNIFKVLGIVQGQTNIDGFIYEENNHKKITIEYTPEERNIFFISLGFLLVILLLIIYFFRKIYFDKNLLDSVINSSDDLIYYKDKNSKYIGCNEAFEKFVGKSKEEIIGKTIKEIFNDRIPDIFSKIDKDVMEKNQGEVFTSWALSLDNKKIFFQTKKTPFKYTLKEIGTLGISRDLTKLKQLEDEQLKQQKIFLIQSKLTSMGEMLGNIAHQWRQPLSVITTIVSGLKLSLEMDNKVSKEEIIKSTDDVIYQSQYLSQTIEDFQNFFASNSSDIEKFNITDALEKMEKLVSHSLHNSNTSLVISSYDCYIIYNENSLIQSFINIINNVKDAMISNNIDEDSRFLFIEVRVAKNKLKIVFKDSAGGIPDSIIDKLFEPYFTTKHKSIGTGIGLYMTHEIITKHFNGNIVVKNKEYSYKGKALKGAQFKVTIPIEEKY